MRNFYRIPSYKGKTAEEAKWFIDAISKQDCKFQEFYKIAYMALDRIIPKKITHQESLVKSSTFPNCLNVVDEFTEFVPGQKIAVKPSYCKFCGQALLWE